MRSSEGFRRPPEPDLNDYWDQLENRLRAEMVENPPRRTRYRSMTRVIRMMVRPALHGSMAMVMVAVVIISGRSAPTALDASDQTTLVSAAVEPLWVDVRPIWVETSEVADPLPKKSLVVLDRRPTRFVTLVSNQSPPWAPLPEINNPATV